MKEKMISHEYPGCTEGLRRAGKSHPRTCTECILGPCKAYPKAAPPVSEAIPAQAKLLCPKCGADRLQSPCGQPQDCAMIGTAHAAVPAQTGTERSPMAQVSDLACAARDLATQYGMVLSIYQRLHSVGTSSDGVETVIAVRLANNLKE